MAVQVKAPAPAQRTFTKGTLFTVLAGVVCFGMLLFLILRIAMQFASPPPAHRLQLVQDIPLPGPLFDAQLKDPLQPGSAVRLDHFDFQALDPQTHLLFIVHSGPNPDKVHLFDSSIDPDVFAKTDGNVLVFDTTKNKLIKRLEIPQGTGIVAAPDLGRVYVAASTDNKIVVIDERTFQTTDIQLTNNDGPDGLAYDPIEHKLFVSNPGVPDPNTNIIDRKNRSEERRVGKECRSRWSPYH